MIEEEEILECGEWREKVNYRGKGWKIMGTEKGDWEGDGSENRKLRSEGRSMDREGGIWKWEREDL
jgi:hypothetical protein